MIPFAILHLDMKSALIMRVICVRRTDFFRTSDANVAHQSLHDSKIYGIRSSHAAYVPETTLRQLDHHP